MQHHRRTSTKFCLVLQAFFVILKEDDMLIFNLYKRLYNFEVMVFSLTEQSVGCIMLGEQKHVVIPWQKSKKLK